ncbi:MAG: site-2 protease family protein [Acidobacteriota bacterium]|nr:site-2 protease family protein [Acidobacteriota bacterium]
MSPTSNDFMMAFINVAILWMLTTPHEFAHAWVATKLGDDTPELEGRLTLQPLAHIDWIGTTLLPFISTLLTGGFIGWGKPVNTNVSKLKYGLNGLLLVALAGPVMNLLFAMVLIVISVATAKVFTPLAEFATQAARLSVYLAVFNLVPVPPLDGSKILIALRFPPFLYNELARFGFILLLLAFQFTGLGIWMANVSYIITASMFHVVQGV